MSPVRASGSACALILLAACAGPAQADVCEATEVCCRRCRPPAVSCYAATPCGPQVCFYEPAPRRCGPIRRLLGLCCPRPVVAYPPPCPPPCPPTPCPGCAPPPGPAAVLPAPPAVTYSPPPPPVPVPEAPRYLPDLNRPGPVPPPVPPVAGSSYRPQPAPAPVPARPLPPRPSSPVRLDRLASFPGG